MVELKSTASNSYAVLCDGKTAGIIVYKSFWEGMPYLSLLRIDAEYRRQGVGKEAMRLFESAMKEAGCKSILTSTRSDECAQNFYRKTGYKECGCLILENTPQNQPMEMFFIKTL